ncbi:MAG: ATP-binding protein [Bacillota bacterium]
MTKRQKPGKNKKREIDELNKQNKRLAIINLVAKSINVQMSYEDIIDQLGDLLHQVISYDLLSFCLLENGTLVIKSGIPKEQQILGVGTVLHKENSAPWQAIMNKQCFLRQDIPNDLQPFKEDQELGKIGIQSAIMAPMLVNNEAIGTLNLGSKQTYAYTEQDFLFVQQLADQLAVCIQNMHLYAEVYQGKKEWEETFKAVQDQIYLLDRERKVLRVNNPGDGSSAANVTGRSCRETFSFCDGNCSSCLIAASYRTGESAFREVSLADRQKIYNIFTYPVFNEMAELYSMVVYIRDVTAKRKLETQLFQSAKLAAVGEMAAGVAHELNSPLTAVIGNAGLLLRKTDANDVAYKMLQDIQNCGMRCKKIIENLLTFSRQDSYAFAPVQLNQVVENSLALIAYQIRKSNIVIEKNYARNLPPFPGNEQQLDQIVINLLLNARDALDENHGGKISIATRMEDHEGKPVLCVEVADTGKGIKAQDLEQIFNPFFTTKGSSKGTGLGLSVSLGIAQTHGGTIKAWSEPGKGSCFKLILPL